MKINSIKKFLPESFSNSIMDPQSDSSSWYDEATDKMVKEIESGCSWIEAVNHAAREYQHNNGGSYDAFEFASDAFSHRAWALGYVDDKNSQHEDKPNEFEDDFEFEKENDDNWQDLNHFEKAGDPEFENLMTKAGIMNHKACELGSSAFLENKNYSSCEYRPGSRGEYDWIKGWQQEYDKKQTQLAESSSLIEDEEWDGDDFYLRYGWLELPKNEKLNEALYNGRKVTLNKPFRTSGEKRKFAVYVNAGRKNKDGEIVAKKVAFGDPDYKIRKSNPKARKSFVARHKCKTNHDQTSAEYWSCRGALSKVGGMW